MKSILAEIRSQRASRRMLFLLDKYRQAFPNEQPPIDPRRVSRWAYETGLWKPVETDPREVLRRKLCRALRYQYITDPQGREVRANYAAIEEVMTPEGPKRMSKWYPIFKAPPEVARQALSLDRRQALATVQQMKLDFDSYNDNNEFGAVLAPLDLDFNKDIEEMSLPVEYDPDPFGDEEDDEG
jgi:hypothetical protein